MKLPKLKLPSLLPIRVNLFPGVRSFDWVFEQKNGDYRLELSTVVPRSGMLSLYNFLAKRVALKFNFLDIEKDFFEVPNEKLFYDLLLKRVGPVLKDIQKQLNREHSSFAFMTWNLAPLQFRRVSPESYKLTILVAGICNE